MKEIYSRQVPSSNGEMEENVTYTNREGIEVKAVKRQYQATWVCKVKDLAQQTTRNGKPVAVLTTLPDSNYYEDLETDIESSEIKISFYNNAKNQEIISKIMKMNPKPGSTVIIKGTRIDQENEDGEVNVSYFGNSISYTAGNPVEYRQKVEDTPDGESKVVPGVTFMSGYASVSEDKKSISLWIPKYQYRDKPKVNDKFPENNFNVTLRMKDGSDIPTWMQERMQQDVPSTSGKLRNHLCVFTVPTKSFKTVTNADGFIQSAEGVFTDVCIRE